MAMGWVTKMAAAGAFVLGSVGAFAQTHKTKMTPPKRHGNESGVGFVTVPKLAVDTERYTIAYPDPANAAFQRNPMGMRVDCDDVTGTYHISVYAGTTDVKTGKTRIVNMTLELDPKDSIGNSSMNNNDSRWKLEQSNPGGSTYNIHGKVYAHSSAPHMNTLGQQESQPAAYFVAHDGVQEYADLDFKGADIAVTFMKNGQMLSAEESAVEAEKLNKMTKNGFHTRTDAAYGEGQTVALMNPRRVVK